MTEPVRVSMIERSDEGGIALIRMAYKPANLLTTEFSDALWEELTSARDDDTIRGVVLTGTGSAFSAGVELFRLVDGPAEYGAALLESVGVLFGGLRTFPKPVVAAINGHAIAEGGVMACACDYRVMGAGSGKIGLPELKVGVPFPAIALDTVRGTIPLRYHREVLLLGRSFDPEAAVVHGFVDEVVPPDEVIPRAREIALELGAIPAATYALTKKQWVRPAGGSDELEEELRAIWLSDETREHVRGYLAQTLGRSTASE